MWPEKEEGGRGPRTRAEALVSISPSHLLLQTSEHLKAGTGAPVLLPQTLQILVHQHLLPQTLESWPPAPPPSDLGVQVPDSYGTPI